MLNKNNMEKTPAQESTLYGGKVQIKFFPDSHIYMVDGKRATGVTTYLGIIDKSRPLIIWATRLYRDFLLSLDGQITVDHIKQGADLHKQKKEEAAAIGDEVHNWIEGYVKGLEVEMPQSKEAQLGVSAFLDWEKANKVKYLSSERVVYSKKHGFVGKMDIEAMVNGKRCLIDIKTSNALYNTYMPQTAAYAKADEEESGKKYEGRWLIRLSKETEAEYIKRMQEKGLETCPPYQVFEAMYLDNEKGNMKRDFTAFIAAKDLFEWNKATDF